MDTFTPMRSRNIPIAASTTKFEEESPVFNFINNLSPIKPLNKTTHAINPLTFASLPSVFTSPHFASRSLQRHRLSDPSKPEYFCSDTRTIFDQNNKKLEATMKLEEQPNFFSYADSSLSGRCGLIANQVADYACSSSTLAPFGEEASQFDQNKEASSCDWSNFFCDASDLLDFESPNDTELHKKSVDCQMTSFGTISEFDSQNHDQVGVGNQTTKNDSNGFIPVSSANNHSQNMDFEHLSAFYRGVRRRCLVFEAAGAGRKKLNEDNKLGSESNCSTSFDDQRLLRPNTINDSLYNNVLPGIGLHLNNLASTSCQTVNNDQEASRKLLIGPSSSIDFHPQMSNAKELLNSSNTVAATASSGGEISTIKNGVPYMANEEMNQTSSKKKRRRMEQTVGGGSCKRCNCKKSKCLKLYVTELSVVELKVCRTCECSYCECFAAGVYCMEPCACIDCFNKRIHEDTVLATRKQIMSRNPLAFAPKVIRASDSVSGYVEDDPKKTPASSRHKRGCNCKKSGCLKKYCECYQSGVGCSVNCRCEGCKNAFGRKDGRGVIGMEVEAHEDIADLADEGEIQLNLKADPVPPSTPLHAGRQSAHHYPLSSNSFNCVGSSSGLYTNTSFGKQSFFQLPPTFDKRLEALAEDEIPDFLQGRSPIKSLSPNKRVSPPQARKLILQSIPSFPSMS